MSRAINVNITEAEVTAMCLRHKVPISAIESLRDGGTRVVFNNAGDTAVIAKALRSNIIQGNAARTPFISRQG